MKEWKEYKLGDIYEVHNGLSKGGKFFGSGYPFLSFSTIFNNWFIPAELSNLVQSTDKEQESYSIKEGDVFITRTSETADELGMSCVALKDYPKATYNGFCKRMRQYNHNIEVLPKYIGYYLRNPNFRLYFQAFSGSMSTRASLTNEALLGLTVKLPPLPTQQKIAAILSSLDDKIELNNKINTNLEQQAQALFKNWFVDKYEKEGTIGDYCSVKSGFAFKSAWWLDEGTKVIRIGDIEQGCLNLETCAHVATDKIEVAKDFIVHGGDLVIAMTGATIGKFSMIPKTQEPILVNQRVGKFFLGNNPIEKVPFIYCTLKQEEVITEFINRGQGSAQPNISTGDILTIPCWIPSKNEIDDFNKTIQPMFETIISNQEENRKLSELRDSLLTKLMSGEIEVGI